MQGCRKGAVTRRQEGRGRVLGKKVGVSDHRLVMAWQLTPQCAVSSLLAPARGGERRAGCLRRGLGRPGQLREGHILRLLGMERLTTLGRVGAVRMEVGQLEMDRAAFLEAHHDVTPLAYCGRLVVAHTDSGVLRWEECGVLRWEECGVLRWEECGVWFFSPEQCVLCGVFLSCDGWGDCPPH